MDEVDSGERVASSELWSEQARAKLTGALSSAVDRAQGNVRDDEEDDLDDLDDMHDLGLNGNLSDELDTPLKRIIRGEGFGSLEKSPRLTNRRRRKANNDKSREGQQQSKLAKEQSEGNKKFVMKLFDRSLDLAQFGPDTSLFTLCRAWIRNAPSTSFDQTAVSRSNSTTPLDVNMGKDSDDLARSQDNKKSENVTELPLCESLDLDDNGVEIRVRIPDLASINDSSDEQLKSAFHLDKISTDRTDLLSVNMNRWQRVRAAWRESAVRNEERYKNSFSVLEEIFEK